MAGITHSIVATGVDSGDQVSRDAWNAEHIVPDGALAQAKIAGLVSALAALAPLLDAALTGTPTAPTAAPNTNTTQIATTAYVRTAVANLVAAAPGVLDTLDELAAALGDDANYAATVTAALAAKQPLAALLTAIAALDGTAGILRQTGAGTLVRLTDTAAGRALLVAADVAAQRTALELGTAATTAATDYATAAHGHASLAPLDSPVFVGTPKAPTVASSTVNDQLATTEFVSVAIGGLGLGALATLATVGTAQIDASAVTNAKMANAPAATLKGNNTAGAATPADLTAAQVKTLLAIVVADVSGAAPLASPALTGTPTAPTATAGTNTTRIATTEFVTAAVAAGGGMSLGLSVAMAAGLTNY